MNNIIIFGDICPDNDYRKLFDTRRTGAFSETIVKDISTANLAMANFECPATQNIVPITKCGPSLRAEPKDVVLLKDLGFDVLSLANNHILDYGMQGVDETLELCTSSGIKTVGAGKNTDEASIPLIYTVGNRKVGIISFSEAEFNLASETTPGAHHFDPYESFDQVKELKRQCDYVVVLYHGGIEYYKYPSPLLQKKCRKFATAGADIVLCQHSHCIGTMEKVENSTILYGQGNSVFGYREGNKSWNEGLVVVVELEEDVTIKLKLIKATSHGIEYASDEECKERVKELMKDSEKLNDKRWIREQWLAYSKRLESLDMPLLYGWNRVLNKLNRIFNNRLINKFYSRRKMMITMNLIRCEAHHEVIQTILEDRVF